ncbi:ficolin-3-like [Culex pipiens pallens]|uniref:ficolin-3-like n=1 Tax=Culex pipiens pallens TaxID=42434 RepID=UPI0022AADBCB|nr:ficolin-3-like [Culex pipiens pallens]
MAAFSVFSLLVLLLGIATARNILENQWDSEPVVKIESPDFAITSCSETSSSGQVSMRIDGLGIFDAVCVQRHRLFGDGWVVIQQRVDRHEDFYRNWAHYRAGFGRLDKNFWMGLEKMHRLTSADPHELVVEMVMNGAYEYARYTSFGVGSEMEKYTLKKVGNYSGTAMDALAVHKGRPFTTFDEDNDSDLIKSCAISTAGGWWFADNCLQVVINS